MDINYLPKSLNLDDNLDIQVFAYNTSKSSTKQKISLTQNVISFLVEGAKEVTSENTPIHIENLSFLIIKKGHCLMTEKLSSSEASYRSILLFFSDEAISQFMKKHNIFKKKKEQSHSVTPIDYDNYTNAIVKSLLEISKLTMGTQKKMLQVKFEELILYLINTKGTEYMSSFFMDNATITNKFISVVKRNKLNKLSLKELSFLSFMSISSFKRAFSNHFSESPSKWFLDRRFEHSAYLLLQKKQRVSDVYNEVGYKTLSSFIQAFKAKYGVTPKQYKRD